MKPETKAELAGFLSRLPEKMAAYLAAAIERDRLSGSGAFPHEFILDALRPALRKSPTRQRIPSPLRLVCEAFEDLLVSGERRRKQPGRISRASIVPVWEWLTNELIPQRAAELGAAISNAVLAGDLAARDAHVIELQKAASSAILERLRTLDPIMQDYRAIEQRLGGPAALLDAREMALMMDAAADLKPLTAKLPKPIETLSEEHVAAIRTTFDEFVASRADQAPYIALMVMGRLERPWEALRMASAVSRKTTDTVISASDLGVIGELLFSDAEELEQGLRAIRQPEFDPAQVARLVEAFAALSTGIVKELGIRKDGKWGQRLMKCRAGVASTMEALMERAPREILAVLPVHQIGGFGARGPRRPNLSRPPDGEKIARAERYAALLSLCRPYAANAAFGAAMNDALDEVAPALRALAEDVVTELRAAQPEARATIEVHLELALRLCERILGEEETDLIRRRGTAAHAAAG